MGLFDRQSRHCKILVDGRNHRRRCGRHSCRALFSADGSGIAKEAATHAKAIIKRRLSLGLVPPPAVANCNTNPSTIAVQCFLPTCRRPRAASFRDKKYDRRSSLRRMRRPSRNYSNYLPPRRWPPEHALVFHGSATLDPRFFSRRRKDLKRLAKIVHGFLSRKNVKIERRIDNFNFDDLKDVLGFLDFEKWTRDHDRIDPRMIDPSFGR